MEITCGIFIIDKNNRVLIAHPTNSDMGDGYWSIPKGHVENNEEYNEAAVREVFEETTIQIDKKSLIPLPEVLYQNGRKTLIPFIAMIPQQNSELTVFCESMVTIEGIEPFPENDIYDWVDLETAKRRLHEAQSRCIDLVIKTLEKPTLQERKELEKLWQKHRLKSIPWNEMAFIIAKEYHKNATINKENENKKEIIDVFTFMLKNTKRWQPLYDNDKKAIKVAEDLLKKIK